MNIRIPTLGSQSFPDQGTIIHRIPLCIMYNTYFLLYYYYTALYYLQRETEAAPLLARALVPAVSMSETPALATLCECLRFARCASSCARTCALLFTCALLVALALYCV